MVCYEKGEKGGKKRKKAREKSKKSAHNFIKTGEGGSKAIYKLNKKTGILLPESVPYLGATNQLLHATNIAPVGLFPAPFLHS